MEKIIIRHLNKTNYYLAKCRKCHAVIERSTSVSKAVCFECRQKAKREYHNKRNALKKKKKTWTASPSTFSSWIIDQKSKIKTIQ